MLTLSPPLLRHALERLADDLLQRQRLHIDTLQGGADLLTAVPQHRQSLKKMVK